MDLDLLADGEVDPAAARDLFEAFEQLEPPGGAKR
jgi:hypothetical protein